MSTNDGDMNNQLPQGPETPTSQGGALTQDVSRRKFLRTAVIGTAGVAGAAGVAGIVLSNSSKPSLGNLGVYGAASSNDPFTAEFEPTKQNADLTTIGGSSGHNYTESYFLVFDMRNLPAGSYQINITQAVNGGTAYPIQAKGGGTTTAPFAYAEGGSSNAVLYYETAGSTATTGPYAKPNGSANASGNIPVSFTTTATKDVLFFLHLQWGAAAPTTNETVTFTITLTNTGTNTVVKTSTFTLNADA